MCSSSDILTSKERVEIFHSIWFFIIHKPRMQCSISFGMRSVLCSPDTRKRVSSARKEHCTALHSSPYPDIYPSLSLGRLRQRRDNVTRIIIYSPYTHLPFHDLYFIEVPICLWIYAYVFVFITSHLKQTYIMQHKDVGS